MSTTIKFQLEEIIDWFEEQINKNPYGSCSVTLTMHDSKISKVDFGVTTLKKMEKQRPV